MRTTFARAAVLALVMTAGAAAQRIDFDNMTAEDLVRSPDFMRITPSVPRGVEVVGPVVQGLCQVKKTDRSPSTDDAIKALKVQAARKGATALAEVTFGKTMTKTTRCITSAWARGTAYVHE